MMKKILLIAIMTAVFISSDAFAEELSVLEAQLNLKNTEIQVLKTEIAGMEAHKDELKTNILAMNEELSSVQAELDELNEKIAIVNEELAEAQKKEDEKKEIFYKRLVVLYEKGKSAYIEAFLGSNDIMQMTKKTEYIRQISEYDKQILDEFANARNEVDARKKELDDICATYQKQKDEFDTQINQTGTEMASISEEISLKNAELKKLTDEKKEIEKKIYKKTSAGKLFTEGEKYLGYPYVWGGSTPETSFDCSGFVCWTYTHSGVFNLPRMTAQDIYDKCKKISPDEARSGDLVFFENTYESSLPVTHVGIYAGNGRMLHCGDPIKYSSINTQYWKSHFYGFGRLED